MSKRKLRSALEIVSDIGALGFDLQHHDDVTIAAAVDLLRTVNPGMFDYLAQVLARPTLRQVGEVPRDA
jgi:hypothetical protein